MSNNEKAKEQKKKRMKVRFKEKIKESSFIIKRKNAKIELN
jgi:hypothetical protein